MNEEMKKVFENTDNRYQKNLTLLRSLDADQLDTFVLLLMEDCIESNNAAKRALEKTITYKV